VERSEHRVFGMCLIEGDSSKVITAENSTAITRWREYTQGPWGCQ
jgi:hypothetical protein